MQYRTQAQAIRDLEKMTGHESQTEKDCTGNTATCKVDECLLCSIRDCPDGEPLHYHHDGCPCCYSEEN